MNDFNILDKPNTYSKIEERSKAIGFDMSSDMQLGSLLRTIVVSKPGSRILELGTGTGLSLSWMVDGMDSVGSLISIDNDPKCINIAATYFGADPRIELVCTDGSTWLKAYVGPRFDMIFADSWPGKYSELEEVLALLNIGGFYVVDDMLPQSNWPEGHEEKASSLIQELENRTDLSITKMNWSTGIIIGVKKS